MILVLITTALIFFDHFITSMDWFWKLQMQATMNQNEKLKTLLETIEEFITATNWIIVLAITLISTIFLIKDKKDKTMWISIYGIYLLVFYTFSLELSD